MTLWKRVNLMKYRIARPINGISLNGVEFLERVDDGNVVEFDNKQDCIDYCNEIGLDEEYVWEHYGDGEDVGYA